MNFTQIFADCHEDSADWKNTLYIHLRKSARHLRKSARNISILFLLSLAGYSQDTLPLHYARTITKEELSSHVYTLASDDFEGRYTGTKGLLKAERYISDDFEDIGLQMPVIEGKQTYLQDFRLNECRWKDQRLTMNGEEFRVGKDFLFLSDPVDIKGDYPVVFTGFGIEDSAYSDLGNIDVKGKIMLVFAGEPKDKDGISFISGTKDLSRKGYYFSKEAIAATQGAEGVFIISRNKSAYKKFLKDREYYNSKPNISYPQKDEETLMHRQAFSAYMNVKTAAKLVDQKPKALDAALEEMETMRKTTAGRFSGHVAIDASSDCQPLHTANVIGIIEGTDLKNEAVVVVAHYDHLGMDNTGIYHGADDNASGTAAVMEIAEAFETAAKEGNRPRRTIIFIAATAEELGLYGSEYYSQNPVISLDSTFACLNIDMIGRASTKLQNGPDYISGYAFNSTEILEISRENCNLTAPELEDRIEYHRKMMGGSDHYYFAKHNIPSLFYFEGFHDDYHKITDTPDKILYDRMEKIVRVIFVTAWELANREERLEIGN